MQMKARDSVKIWLTPQNPRSFRPPVAHSSAEVHSLVCEGSCIRIITCLLAPRRTRRPLLGRWLLPRAPDRRQMLGVRRREDVLAVGLRDEIEIAARGRVQRRDVSEEVSHNQCSRVSHTWTSVRSACTPLPRSARGSSGWTRISKPAFRPPDLSTILAREEVHLSIPGSMLTEDFYADPESAHCGRGQVGRSEERRVGKECRSRWSPYH